MSLLSYLSAKVESTPHRKRDKSMAVTSKDSKDRTRSLVCTCVDVRMLHNTTEKIKRQQINVYRGARWMRARIERRDKMHPTMFAKRKVSISRRDTTYDNDIIYKNL